MAGQRSVYGWPDAHSKCETQLLFAGMSNKTPALDSSSTGRVQGVKAPHVVKLESSRFTQSRPGITALTSRWY